MSVSLQKGQKVSLTKENAGLTSVMVALGWDEAERKRGLFSPKPEPIDCDASAFLLTNGKVARKEDVVYFGNLTHMSGAVRHMGDNLTGEGDGDDEQIFVDLQNVPADYDRIAIVVNIYQCEQRRQHFGMIKNAYIRIMDGKNGKELCRYNLTDDYSNMTAMIFGEVYRHGSEWKFNAVGQGTTDAGINELIKRF
ncbi:MAG: TerD family protein [Lachnospiraceae bacterium]|nr:TerD family protein [Lachnospiraceae bacterium]MBQ5851250.1 TerD family protein [Lachnospiraceae bacterium]